MYVCFSVKVSFSHCLHSVNIYSIMCAVLGEKKYKSSSFRMVRVNSNSILFFFFLLICTTHPSSHVRAVSNLNSFCQTIERTKCKNCTHGKWNTFAALEQRNKKRFPLQHTFRRIVFVNFCVTFSLFLILHVYACKYHIHLHIR